MISERAAGAPPWLLLLTKYEADLFLPAALPLPMQ